MWTVQDNYTFYKEGQPLSRWNNLELFPRDMFAKTSSV